MQATLTVDLGLERPDATIELLQTIVTVNAKPSREATGPRRTFAITVEPKDKLMLRVEVPSLKKGNRDFIPPDLVFFQELTVDASGTLSLIGSSDITNPRVKGGPRHSRVNLQQARPPYGIKLDLTFIDVTSLLDREKKLTDYREPAYAVNGLRDPGWDGKDESQIHHGCQLRVLQMTNGNPKCWAVVIPPGLDGGRVRFNVLVFFQPALLTEHEKKHPYTSALDCSGLIAPNLPRYTRDPPAWGPYYYQERTNRSFIRRPHPYTGFEGQLAASKKPVLLVMPYPKNDSQGRTSYGDALKADLPKVLRSLLYALWAGGAIGDKQDQGVELSRLALGGFSFGGGAATAAFGANMKATSELYLMDAEGYPDSQSLANWLKQGDRRLCMVGGRDLAKVLAKRSEVEKLGGKNVFVAPPNPDYYDTPGTPWHAALFLPGSEPDSGPKLLSAVGEPDSELTRQSKVSIASKRPLTLRAQLGGKVVDRALDVTTVEASGLVRLWQVSSDGAAPGKQAIKIEKDFDGITKSGVKVGQWDVGPGVMGDMRHQWAVGGGFGNPIRYPYGEQDEAKPDGKLFEGHLQFCLKGSGFT
jgi:hypothetical protein